METKQILRTLNGTERQIDFAKKIRGDLCLNAEMQEYIDYIYSIEDADFIIENRKNLVYRREKGLTDFLKRKMGIKEDYKKITLKGTEKQIKYAGKIRENLIIEVSSFLDGKNYYLNYRTRYTSDEEFKEKTVKRLQVITEMEGYIDYINSIESAKFIIENEDLLNIENIGLNEELKEKLEVKCLSKQAYKAIGFANRNIEGMK